MKAAARKSVAKTQSSRSNKQTNKTIPLLLLGLIGNAVGASSWVNVFDPSTAWTFDLGSQVGYRTAPTSGGSSIAIAGPAPDWALSAKDVPSMTFDVKTAAGSGNAKIQRSTLLPGQLSLSKMASTVPVQMSIDLIFVSANTSIVRFATKNLNQVHVINVSLVVGVLATNSLTKAAAANGADFGLPRPSKSSLSCLDNADFTHGGFRILNDSSTAWSMDAQATKLTASSSVVTLRPGTEFVVYFTVSVGRSEQCDAAAAHVQAIGPASAWAASRARWDGYIGAVLAPMKNSTIYGGHKSNAAQQLMNMKWSAVKAVMTIVNNWRVVPHRGRGVVPSYVKYDTGFWSWDTYKQAVATAQFDASLAKDQLRLIVSARNKTTGHIPDDVDRCGDGGGCPGKPNLLSWAVMEVYAKDLSVEFVAEMYPIIEAFHHYTYKTHDTRGVGMCSWKWSSESGMDNGVRFKFGGLHNGEAQIEYNKSVPCETNMKGHYGKCGTYDFWSVDINAYLYREKGVLAQMATLLHNTSGAAYWKADAAQLLPRLREMFYVPAAAPSSPSSPATVAASTSNRTPKAPKAPKAGFFQDRFFNQSMMPVRGCEGFAALFCGVASPTQASSMVLSTIRIFSCLNFRCHLSRKPTLTSLRWNTGKARHGSIRPGLQHKVIFIFIFISFYY
jgi:hypothetical protein